MEDGQERKRKETGQEGRIGKKGGEGKGRTICDAEEEITFLEVKDDKMVNKHRQPVVSRSQTNSVSLVFAENYIHFKPKEKETKKSQGRV